MSEAPALHALGERVRVDTIVPGDVSSYRRAVQGSADRIRPWNPVNPDDLRYHLQRQSDLHRSFLIRALPRHAAGSHDIVGKVNVTGITRGRAFNGVLGYDSYDPYQGTGMFTEGLSLVVDLAFRALPDGLGLNRVEAAVQPHNVRSAGVLRRLGFRRRGAFPRYLWLGDASGHEAWRDHVVYGIDRVDWPSVPYAVDAPGGVVVVAHPAGPDPTPLEVATARHLARELGVPLLRGSGSWREQIEDAVTGAVLLAEVDDWEREGLPDVPRLQLADLGDAAAIARAALRVAAAHRAGDPHRDERVRN